MTNMLRYYLLALTLCLACLSPTFACAQGTVGYTHTGYLTNEYGRRVYHTVRHRRHRVVRHTRVVYHYHYRVVHHYRHRHRHHDGISIRVHL